MFARPSAKAAQHDHSKTSRHQEPTNRHPAAPSSRIDGIALTEHQLAALFTVQPTSTCIPAFVTGTPIRPSSSDCNRLCVGPAAAGQELARIWTQSAAITTELVLLSAAAVRPAAALPSALTISPSNQLLQLLLLASQLVLCPALPLCSQPATNSTIDALLLATSHQLLSQHRQPHQLPLCCTAG